MSCRCHETGVANAFGLFLALDDPNKLERDPQMVELRDEFGAWVANISAGGTLTYWQADAYLDRIERVQDEADAMKATDAFRGAGLRKAADATHAAITDGVGKLSLLDADQRVIALELLHVRYLAELAATKTRPAGASGGGTKGQTPPTVTSSGGTGADRAGGAGSTARPTSGQAVTLGVVAVAALAFWVLR